MIVNDLDFVRISPDPSEADPPLVIDPDAVLVRSIAGELLQSIGRWRAQIFQINGRVELTEFSKGGSLNIGS